MFKSLKEKFSSWLKSEKPVETPKKAKTNKGKNQSTLPKNLEESLKKKSAKIKDSLSEKLSVTSKKNPDLSLLQQPKIEEQLLGKTLSIKDNNQKEQPGFFARLKSKLLTSTLTKEQFDEIFQDLEIILLENNVALEVVDKIHASLSKDLVGIEIKKSEIDSTILQSLKSSILSLLIEPPDLIKDIKKSLEPYVILFFGINGSGKTTSIAKLASYLKKNKISCVLAAGDTFRAASIEQLAHHANALKVPIIKHDYGSDPSSVAFDAIAYAKKNKISCVLIDTAGRMYTQSNLLREMGKIVRISKPNLKIFVGESITGNDATQQAKTFNESIGIDGIILSKADVDEKAGTILSVSQVTNKPIYFLGTGQSYSDFQVFSKKLVLKNLGL